MLKPLGAKTVDEYIGQIDEPRRSYIRALHTAIAKAVPELAPSIQFDRIGYGTYAFKHVTGRVSYEPIISLVSQESYITIFLSGMEDGRSIPDKYARWFPKADVGKICIRVRRPSDIDYKALEKVLRLSAKVMAESPHDR